VVAFRLVLFSPNKLKSTKTTFKWFPADKYKHKYPIEYTL
jgi:hypothetical protein